MARLPVRTVTMATGVALAVVLGGCGGLVPGADSVPIIDVPGVGPARVAVPANVPVNEGVGRWTGALGIFETEDRQIVIAWNGGPGDCWAFQTARLEIRAGRLLATIGERFVATGGGCGGERVAWAVFVPLDAVPAGGEPAFWPR